MIAKFRIDEVNGDPEFRMVCQRLPYFAELAGDGAAGVKVARLAGGPGGRVTAGFGVPAAALGEHPRLRGAALAAALHAELSVAEPTGTGWRITEMSHVPTGMERR